MIIEIIGPAASGKTTLSQALPSRTSQVKIETPPTFREPRNIPFFSRNIFSILPCLPQIYTRKDHRFSLRDHFLYIMLLNGWHKILKQKTLNEKSVLLLDPGPVYVFGIEILFGSGWKKSTSLQRFWDKAYQSWANTMDMVVYLDTELTVLFDRIYVRETDHTVKGITEENAMQYLESYRQVYESILSQLSACSTSLKILRLDTGKHTLDESLDIIIQNLQLENDR